MKIAVQGCNDGFWCWDTEAPKCHGGHALEAHITKADSVATFEK